MQTCTFQKILLSVVLMGLMSMFMFFRLGHYALWDDEATTALFAQSVWQTGDTYAVLDDNLIAYNSGVELKNLKNRYISPLAFYLAAPFVGPNPGSAFFARLPFAICGILSIGLILVWLWRSSLSVLSWILVSIGLLGNVSLILYVRQCRYYAPVILFSCCLCYLYCQREHQHRKFLFISIAGLLLLASNYLCYAGVILCLFVDYLIWGRRDKPVSRKCMLGFIATQLLLGGWLVSIYNPLGITVFGATSESWIVKSGTLFLWNWRELNASEFTPLLLLLAAPIISIFVKDQRLLRCSVGVFIYVLTISILSPQPIKLVPVAFVRYLIPVIPVCIFISAMCIEHLTRQHRWWAIGLAAVVFGTNLVHGGPLISRAGQTIFSEPIRSYPVESRIVSYLKELYRPPTSAYYKTATWINQYVNSKDSIWVSPDYATYPLMFHASKPIYAWQLHHESTQFTNFDRIHFFGEVPPQFIVAFGPYVAQVKNFLQDWENQGIRYELVQKISHYWYDLIRPELFWHTFTEIEPSNENQIISIFRRIGP